MTHFNNWQVPSKLVSDETRLAATWVAMNEPPPDYCESDPLQCESGAEGPPVFRFGSFSSTGSFWDEDDDVTDAAVTGPVWSGGLLRIILFVVECFLAQRVHN